MRYRLLPLAALLALAACESSPTAAARPSLNGGMIGSGTRQEPAGPSESSGLIGSGTRAETDSASRSPMMGGGAG
jgi:hypothetical protein